MSGPNKPEEALAWFRDALRDGRYIPSTHFRERLAERNLSMVDVFAISAGTAATVAEPYDDEPRHGGTCWRIWGRDADGERECAVGVELFSDKKRRRLVLCTMFVKESS